MNIIYLFLFLSLVILKEYPPLQFQQDKFKILQLTDLHFGETLERDENNQDLIKKLVEIEKPDIVVVTGDMVSGHAWNRSEQNWYEQKYQKMTQILIEQNQQWAVIGGNHDAQTDLTREEVHQLDMSYNLSQTRGNAIENMSHSFNYIIPVYKDDNIVFRMFFVDSGDRGCYNYIGYDCLRGDQLQWIRQEGLQIQQQKGKGILFMHVPIYEFVNLANNHQYYGIKQESVSCQAINTGLLGVIKEVNLCEWISVGHDHDNDYYGLYDDIYLSYGRKTGYGSYLHNLKHGARVFEFTLKDGLEYDIQTWIREEDGGKYIQDDLHYKPEDMAIQSICVKEEDKQYIFGIIQEEL